MNSKKISFFSKLPRSGIVLALLLILGVGAFLGYQYFQKKNTTSKNSDAVDTINFSPPTEEEKRAADEQKIDAEEQQKRDEQTQPQGGSNQVTPIITSAGQYNDDQYGNRIEVRAFIPNIYEENGTCKVTFTQSGQTFTRTVEALKDATTTRCDTVFIPRSDFPGPGKWNVIAEYYSNSSTGKSATTEIEVK